MGQPITSDDEANSDDIELSFRNSRLKYSCLETWLKKDMRLRLEHKSKIKPE